MRISFSLLLPALIGAASAASDAASVYIFQGQDLPSSPNPPILTPEEARLVIAQRLGVAQYHSLKGASETTLAYINNFGGQQDSVFDGATQDKASELVLVVEGLSSETAEPLLTLWDSPSPAFFITKPPSTKANQKLASDLNQQRHRSADAWDMGCELKQAINPFNEKCWAGTTKILHIDLSTKAKNRISIEDLMRVGEILRGLAKREEMNVVLVLMPQSSGSTKIYTKAYGSYEMPLGAHTKLVGRQQAEQAEEPMTEISFEASPVSVSSDSQASQFVDSNSSYPPLRGVVAWCHSSVDACISATNNCSGHGSCFAKYNSTDSAGDGKSGCFTCGCLPEIGTVGKNNYIKTTYWGGAACNKKDVSGPFWLLAGLSLILVGIVGWAISLLFSIGEEKLPGVIGAGVSSKTR